MVARRRAARSRSCGALALRELEAAASAATAVLLALLHARVARELTRRAQRAVLVGVQRLERARETQAHSVGLAGGAAAEDVDEHVVAAFELRGAQRTDGAALVLQAPEELVERLAVDDESAGAGVQAHARDGGLAASQAPGEDRIGHRGDRCGDRSGDRCA